MHFNPLKSTVPVAGAVPVTSIAIAAVPPLGATGLVKTVIVLNRGVVPDAVTVQPLKVTTGWLLNETKEYCGTNFLLFLKYLSYKMTLIKVVQQPFVIGPGTQPGPICFP
jgi:hypothetical protein